MTNENTTAAICTALEQIDSLLLLAKQRHTNYANPNLNPLNEARRLVEVVTRTVRGPIGELGAITPGTISPAVNAARAYQSDDVRDMAQKLAPGSRMPQANLDEIERKVNAQPTKAPTMPDVNQKV